MKRFFKWVGIVIGGFIGLIVLLLVGLVIAEIINDPNRDVSLARTYPAPGNTPVDLLSGRKQENGKVTGWRIYVREKGNTGLPRNALLTYDADLEPRVEWKSPNEANICIDIKQGTINLSPVDGMATTTSAGGKIEATVNNVRYLVNHNC